jgi:hypothetical protein
LGYLGTAIGAGNDAHLAVGVCVGIQRRKALGKADARKGAVGIDGAKGIHPTPVSQNLDPTAARVEWRGIRKKSAACGVGLANQQKRMQQKYE